MENQKRVSGSSKRERSINFTSEETNLLVSLAETKKNIIENKKSDATTWQDKEKAWKDIEKAFNSSSGSVFRDHKHLKLKYEAIKRETRKKSAIVRAERYKTGGGTSMAPPLTPAEQKVKEMILLSVDGSESEFDSDLVLPSTSTSSSVLTWAPNEELGNQAAADQIPLTDDSSKNIIIEFEDQITEPPIKKVCAKKQKETTLLQRETDNVSQPEEIQWKEWNPTALKSKKHPVLSKPKEKRPFDRLTEEKLEIAKIQRKVITEELEQKLLQRKILEKELEHKAVIQELEKQHLLLKIEILKKELDKK